MIGRTLRTYARSLFPARPAPAPRTVRLDFDACDIHLHATAEPELRWRAFACAKEPWTVEWLLQRLRGGDVLYDVGANVGAFSLIAAKHCGATVVAFEPGYATFARLCENVQLNACADRIIPVPLPLSDRSGILSLQYRSLEPGQSRHRMGEAAWRPEDSTLRKRYVQPVCAMALDAAVSTFDLPLPAAMKIDVDGAELRVLRGASTLLAGTALRSLLIEIDHGQFDDVHDLLADAGFALENRIERGRKANAPVYAVFGRAPSADTGS